MDAMFTLPGLLSFAQVEPAQKLTAEQKQQLVWLILFVLAAGLSLIVIVILMMRVWRRNLARLAAERRDLAATIPDIWKAGGDRLIAKMSPFPKADDSAPHANYDGDNPESDDDDLPFKDEEDDDEDPPFKPRR